MTDDEDLLTSTCPFCFFAGAPYPGFNVCPRCGKDTRRIMGHFRFGDPDELHGLEAEAAYRWDRVRAGIEPPPHVDTATGVEVAEGGEAKT